MKRIDVYFLLLATLMLLSGVLLGIHMSMNADFALRPVHAHANLVGWASLALFGLTYRAWPQLKEGMIARIHFAVAAASSILMPYGIYLAVLKDEHAIAAITSMGWALAVVLFLVQIVKLLRAPAD